MDDFAQFNNVDGFIQGPIPGFIEKYFGSFDFNAKNNSLTIHSISGRSYACEVPPTDEFLDRFPRSLEEYKSFQSGDTHYSWKLKDDDSLILSSPSTDLESHNSTEWTHVQAIGRYYTQENIDYKDGLLALSELACRAFIVQSTRKFLHGFYLRGRLLEAWVFDRAGLYCSSLIDIEKDFHQFLAIVLSYQTMTNIELGEHGVLQFDNASPFVEFKNAPYPSLQKLYLDKEPLRYRKALVGSGIVCYRAKVSIESSSWSYVVKFKWRRTVDRPESELLRLAERDCKWQPFLHQEYYEEPARTQDYAPTYEWERPKRFISEQDTNQNGDIKGVAAYTTMLPTQLHRDRVLLYSITSPVGRSVETFRSLRELLTVFGDVLGCHRSLYFDAGIIHRDVSAGNFIILDDRQPGGMPRGLLIDLDQSILRTDKLIPGKSIVGTKVFMAIGALKGEVPTYRHDLEAFLYLFVWLLISDGAGTLPESSELCRWNQGSLQDAAQCKIRDMDPCRFESILDKELPAKYSLAKPLAQEWRQILFPDRDGKLWTGTDESDDVAESLYAQIIGLIQESLDMRCVI